MQVKDVADQPPEFVDVPSVTRISENVEPFSEVSVILHIYLEGLLIKHSF